MIFYRNRNRKAQNTLEYVIVVTVIAASLIGMYKYINYLVLGRQRVISDYVAEREDL